MSGADKKILAKVELNFEFLLDFYSLFGAMGVPPLKLWRDRAVILEQYSTACSDVLFKESLDDLFAGHHPQTRDSICHFPRWHKKEDYQGLGPRNYYDRLCVPVCFY